MATFQIEIPQQLLHDILELSEKSAKRGANNAANDMIRQGYNSIIKDLEHARTSIIHVSQVKTK